MGLLHVFNVARAAFHESAKALTRSPAWRSVERSFLETHPQCAACDGKTRLQVHHKKPYALFPELELELSNLVTLCMGELECHLRIGHGGSFRFYNPHIEQDLRVLFMGLRRDVVELGARRDRLPL